MKTHTMWRSFHYTAAFWLSSTSKENCIILPTSLSVRILTQPYLGMLLDLITSWLRNILRRGNTSRKPIIWTRISQQAGLHLDIALQPRTNQNKRWLHTVLQHVSFQAVILQICSSGWNISGWITSKRRYFNSTRQRQYAQMTPWFSTKSEFACTNRKIMTWHLKISVLP